jgi:hypothetical protein
MDETVKIIILPVHKPSKSKSDKRDSEPRNTDGEEKVAKKKVITETNKWIFEESDYVHENQFDIIKKLYENLNNGGATEKDVGAKGALVLRELQKKISGYRGQDVIKELFDEAAFIDMPSVIHLLYHSQLICFYCREPVKVIYENVREPKQWSLERINNQYGHNKGNLEIACLTCNVRRGTMYHERYVFTKQLSIVKKK